MFNIIKFLKIIEYFVITYSNSIYYFCGIVFIIYLDYWIYKREFLNIFEIYDKEKIKNNDKEKDNNKENMKRKFWFIICVFIFCAILVLNVYIIKTKIFTIFPKLFLILISNIILYNIYSHYATTVTGTAIIGLLPIIGCLIYFDNIYITLPHINEEAIFNLLTMIVTAFTIFISAFMVGIIIQWYTKLINPSPASTLKDKPTSDMSLTKDEKIINRKSLIRNILITVYYWLGIGLLLYKILILLYN